MDDDAFRDKAKGNIASVSQSSIREGTCRRSYPNSKWEIVAKITNLLEVYKKATTYLSGVYYPTSNLSPRDGQKPRASQPTRASQPMLLLAFSRFSFIQYTYPIKKGAAFFSLVFQSTESRMSTCASNLDYSNFPTSQSWHDRITNGSF